MISPILALLPAVAAAPPEVAEADRWISTDRIALGVHVDGSLVNDTVGLGLLWDPDGPEGPMPTGGDWLTPGRQFEVWSAAWATVGDEGVIIHGGASWKTDLLLSWDGPYNSGAVTWLHGAGANEDVAVDTWIEAPWGRDVAWLTLRFEALADLSDLRALRVVDPDPDWWITGSHDTVAWGGDGWAVAEGDEDDRALAISALDGFGAVCTWCMTPSELEGEAMSGPADGDYQIAVLVDLGDLAAGDTATVTFAYGLAIGRGDAVALALEAAADDDHDADGETSTSGDCDDRDPAVSTAALESPNGIDDDCDGAVDEGSPWTDDDGDGYAESQGDCDDDDPAVHPGADPAEGVTDADCDGVADTGDWPPALDTGEASAVEPAGCGCASKPGRTSVAGLLTLLLAFAARRRSR